VAPEVPVPGTGTSGPTRSDRWSLDPSRSDRCERLGPTGSSTGTSGQRPIVNPHTRDHAQRLLCGLPFTDRNFRLWTELLVMDRNFRSDTKSVFSNASASLTAQPELPVRLTGTSGQAPKVPPEVPTELPVLHFQNQLKPC